MSALLSLRAEAQPEYVRGGPIHVAVEVGFDPPPEVPGVPIVDELEELPRLELFSPSATLGLELRDAAGVVRLAQPARSGAIEPEAVPSYTLRPGERRRVLVELSERLPALPDDEYHLSPSYEAEGRRCFAEPLVLRLRDPRPDELPVVSGIRWSRWSLTDPEPDHAIPEIGADDPARFCRVIRRLVRGSTPLAELDPARLGALASGLYAPEHAALSVELWVARQAHPSARALAEQTEQRWPGMRWWLRDALAGQGPITALRRLLERLR